MNASGVVIEILDGGYAVVQTERKSACAQCHDRRGGRGCGACDIFLGGDSINAVCENRVGARLGDEVTVESDSSAVILNAFLVFILPLLGAAAGYLVSGLFFEASEYRALCAVGALAVCFTAVFLYSRFKKSNRDRIIITEIRKADKDGRGE